MTRPHTALTPGVAPARVLIVAGSDSGGGAGIQADIKTVTALGGYAATAISAITVQDSMAVHDVFPLPAHLVAAQMRVVLGDIGADVIKTGMLQDRAVIDAVVAQIDAQAAETPLIVDPVMVSTSGHRLIDQAAREALKTALVPRATLLTPNLAEAADLLGHDIASEPVAMAEAAEALLAMGPKAVLVKGGHGTADRVVDCLATPGGTEHFAALRIATRHTHGTGCTLASALAEGVGRGLGLVDAVARGRAFVHGALSAAPGFGAGHGPLGHHWMITS